MDLYPIKLNLKGNAPIAAIVGFSILSLAANLALLLITAAVIGLGLRIGLGID